MNVNPFSYLIEQLKGYVSKSGDTVFGDLTVNAENGTANVDAYTYLKVGNQTPKSSAKHSTGLLRLCGENGKYTDIYAPNSTASRDIVFPDKSGTVALASQLQTISVPIAGTSISSYYAQINLDSLDYYSDIPLCIWDGNVWPEKVVFSISKNTTTKKFVLLIRSLRDATLTIGSSYSPLTIVYFKP